MFNCREVTRMVSESMDREMPLIQRMGIRFHLMMCRWCSRYRKQLLFIRTVLKLYLAREDQLELADGLPQEARERIKLALKRHET
jgi:hypothetical protein